jgi:hypothetical protein
MFTNTLRCSPFQDLPTLFKYVATCHEAWLLGTQEETMS